MAAYWQQIRKLFSSMSLRQRIALGVAALIVIGSIYGLRVWQQERNFKTLFQNLSAEDAGLVLARLKESGTEVRLENSGQTIKVPSEQVDELRIKLASSGLPKTGRIGYELFDKTNFGTTEFAEQVNYHRAVEGELERSVMTLQEVEAARVHITFPRKSLFLENRQPAKASVLIKLKPGATLAKPNLVAIAHLTASAVEGLTPSGVSILDMRGNLLLKPQEEGAENEEVSHRLLEYQNRMERELLQKVQATLEPLVGTDGFRASVSLDCDMTSGDQSEETFDPNRSVMVNAQRSEDGSAPVASNGVPGTASNLPRPTSRPGTGTGSLYRRTENTTFQTSRVVRRLKIPQGQIRRLSTSVLLDYTVRVQGGKRTLEAPAPERLRAIRELVGAAVGYREDRGDRITIEALPFEITKNEPAPVAQTPVAPRPQLPAWIPDWIRVPLEGNLTWLMGQSWLPIAVLTLIAGILFAVYAAIRGLVRRVIHFVAQRKAGKLKGQHVDITVGNAIGGPQAAGQLDTGSATENVSTVDALEKKLKNREEEQERLTVEALNALEVPKAELHKGEVLTRHIHELVKKDPVSIANLLRTWLADTGR